MVTCLPDGVTGTANIGKQRLQSPPPPTPLVECDGNSLFEVLSHLPGLRISTTSSIHHQREAGQRKDGRLSRALREDVEAGTVNSNRRSVGAARWLGRLRGIRGEVYHDGFQATAKRLHTWQGRSKEGNTEYGSDDADVTTRCIRHYLRYIGLCVKRFGERKRNPALVGVDSLLVMINVGQTDLLAFDVDKFNRMDVDFNKTP